MSEKDISFPREETTLVNPCFYCGVEMGTINSRQLCKKTYCGNATYADVVKK